MATIQDNLILARQHLRQINHDLHHFDKSDLLEVVPSIYENVRGTYMSIRGKRKYVPVSQKKELFKRIEKTLRYKELITKKVELEMWIYQMESDLVRLSSQNFPRVAI